MQNKQSQSTAAVIPLIKRDIVLCPELTGHQETFIMMRAWLSLWLVSAAVCLCLAHHHLSYDQSDDQDTAVENATDGVSLVAAANREFAFRLYRKLAAHADSQGKNVFYSPRSVSLALSALSAGARGETHQQLFSGLGFNSSVLTQAAVDEAFRTMLRKANAKSSKDSSEGTAVFIDDHFKANPDFLSVLQRSYSAEAFNVDFLKTKESADTINDYVSKKTSGKIDKLVEGLDASTVMYLISYIYFKGKWETPFEPESTRADEFLVDENTKVPVQMMYMEESVHTYYDMSINTSVLYLPFNGSSYGMMLLLPDDMETLENSICPAHVTKWLKWMKKKQYDIHVPKFSIKTSYDLKDILTDMGMSDMFGDRANLAGISDLKLAVSQVVHKATLDVDEAGATATAATGIGITLLSFRIVPVLKFNRPFMVVVIDRVSQDTLFLGKIVNPNV
nr:serine protease inhibitor A3N-like [Solea senegalensis]